MWSFLLHIVVSSLIFGLMGLGFKIFLKLRSTLDFSYIGIIIFSAYASSLVNIHRGWGILWSMAIAIVFSLFFTGFVLYLSDRLSGAYFDIGTLAFYILCLQLAFNLEWITGGALGLSGMGRNFVWSLSLWSLESYGIMTIIVSLLCLFFLSRFKKTYFYTILRWRGERELVVKSLWVEVSIYKFTMIVITTVLAAIGWSLFAFYYLYIDPPSFWLYLLTLLVIIGLVSYRINDWWTMLVALGVVFFYEILRFAKIVDPSQVWYVREIMIVLIQVFAAYLVFKKHGFERSQ